MRFLRLLPKNWHIFAFRNTRLARSKKIVYYIICENFALRLHKEG